jgi:ABC-type transporter Mla maintaining outer membrane lipid asymmetry ATPase subunit MlaF
VHDGVSFAVRRGEVVALIGGSGTGKSVLLKEMIGLLQAHGGQRAPARHRRLAERQEQLDGCAAASACCSRTAPCSRR